MATLHFSICGDFITQIAREKFYCEHKLASAIEILQGATVTDQLSESEHLMLCLEIIAGKKNIVGTYPGDDYGVETNEDVTFSVTDFIREIDKVSDEIKEKEQELNEMYRKFAFVIGELEPWEIRTMARKYYEEYDEHLFQDDSGITDNNFVEYLAKAYDDDKQSGLSASVESVIKRMSDTKEHTYEDYGWLEPDGTYHEVEWGNHSSWAREWADEHYPFSEYHNMYWKTNANGERTHYVNGDFLVHCLGWVLLDSPYQGLAKPQYDPIKGMTKAQKEFMYDYYMERERHQEANALWSDD